jgi:hypothetical protein
VYPQVLRVTPLLLLLRHCCHRQVHHRWQPACASAFCRLQLLALLLLLCCCQRHHQRLSPTQLLLLLWALLPE